MSLLDQNEVEIHVAEKHCAYDFFIKMSPDQIEHNLISTSENLSYSGEE